MDTDKNPSAIAIANLNFQKFSRSQVYKANVRITELQKWKTQSSFYPNLTHGPLFRGSETTHSGKCLKGEYLIPISINFEAMQHPEIATIVDGLLQSAASFEARIDPILYAQCSEDVDYTLNFNLERGSISQAEATLLRERLEEQGGIETLVEEGCCLTEISIKSIDGRLFTIFSFYCKWEVEHGTALVFEKSQIVALGGAHDFDDLTDLRHFELFTRKLEDLLKGKSR
jgi:hypothetical protein